MMAQDKKAPTGTTHGDNELVTIWKLFVGDVRRITMNVVSVIIVIGLVALPGLFTWFNVAASWDPFSNTGNLTFAVASDDEGYQGDLLPTKVTVGDRVLDELRKNSQMNWVFTTHDDAIDGTKSGKYYASVVIDTDFSRDLMTFFTDDVHHAKLTYYTNEKKNALAPKITGEGADQVAKQVNLVFATTITTVGLSVASMINDELSTPNARQRIGLFNDNIEDFAEDLSNSVDTMRAFGKLTDSSSSLLQTSYTMLDTASAGASETADLLNESQQGVASVDDALSSAISTLAGALASSGNGYASVGNAIDELYNSAGKSAGDVSAGLRDQANAVQDQIDEYTKIKKTVDDLKDNSPEDETKDALTAISDSLGRAIERQNRLKDTLTDAASNIDTGTQNATNDHQQVKKLTKEAQENINQLETQVNTTLKPQMETISSSLSESTSLLSDAISGAQVSVDSMGASMDDTTSGLATTRQVLNSTADLLDDTRQDLLTYHDKLQDALDSGDMNKIREVLSADPASMAAILTQPVGINYNAIFPVESFGAAFTPFYSLISLWVGSLLAAVTLKTSVSRKTREELGDPRPHVLFFGHFGVFALISLLQSTFMASGTLLFLNVDTVYPWLFMLAAWISGLVYMFIIYTFVVSFGNVGKALGVILLIVQISGSSGAYPLEMLPGFIGTLSPFLPMHHSVQAMRSAIAGIYQYDYWISLGKLLLFILPALLLGLVLRKPLIRFNRWYIAMVESTQLL